MTEKNQNRVRAFCRFAIVYVLLFICAGNITNSMLLKWGFRDDQKGDFATSYSLVGMMNGDAPKPYVYRSSFPTAAKWIVEQLDQAKQDTLFKSIKRHDSLRNAYFTSVPEEYWTPVTALVYHLTYIAIVLSTLFALLLIYKLARLHGLGFGHSVGFLAAFSFVYPLTFQQGGYYYDFFELLGVLGACYFLIKRRMLACTLMIAVFSLNKETFFLVPLALFLLHERDVAMSRRVAWLVLQLGICIATRQFIMSGYSENAGGFVEYHVWDNLKFWVNPKSYLSFYNLIGKGIFTPSLENPLMVVPLAVFFRAAWRATPTRYRSYFFAAFLPVLVLFIFFGYRDEARNFSVVFPALVLIALHGANRFDAIFSSSTDTSGDSRVSPNRRTDIEVATEAAR
ncbi:hypothetical protein DF046_03985 [Burkholderia cepacia]|uniref:hypothetical protein n=1 Tax=Burkholderia cepacia TaxID=292 RepID=UPI000757BE20|nr:hypothetical protein [Burkholderia cepacia]OUE39729.1 hypothetical protein BZY94_29905 [Burkholderia territorii]KVX52028.1 hypothetical protein WL06_20195 [Burkholderia cepacia]KWD54853.1 hypothetical protein WL68_33765 [Burkholderia cepacia]KWD87309.1 hypothetical protein WL69_07565 [Burkholderia cepacia]MDN7912681.1 hypothetical protein [Burkholderia cepacia]